MPSTGAAATNPACASVNPSRVTRAGMRKAAPCTATAEAAWASVVAPSMLHRRREPTTTASSTAGRVGSTGPVNVAVATYAAVSHRIVRPRRDGPGARVGGEAYG